MYILEHSNSSDGIYTNATRSADAQEVSQLEASVLRCRSAESLLLKCLACSTRIPNDLASDIESFVRLGRQEWQVDDALERRAATRDSRKPENVVK